MSLVIRRIAVIVMISVAALVSACGSESDLPDPDELDRIGEELEHGLMQADLKPVEQIDGEIQNIEAE